MKYLPLLLISFLLSSFPSNAQETATNGNKHCMNKEKVLKNHQCANSNFIDIMGFNTHYIEEGIGKSEVPIILIHGFASFCFTWDAWATDLQKDHHIIRLDMPMFGLTGPSETFQPEDYNIELSVQFLEAFFKLKGIDDVHLVGNSLGGWIAAMYASAHPEQVQSLTLIDSAGTLPADEAPLVVKVASVNAVKKRYSKGVPKWVISNRMRSAYANPDRMTEENIQRYYEINNIEENLPELFNAASAMPEPDLSIFPKIKAPTLILWGADDKWIPLKHAYLLDLHIPNSQVKVINNCGHAPQEECPEESIIPFKSFLRQF